MSWRPGGANWHAAEQGDEADAARGATLAHRTGAVAPQVVNLAAKLLAANPRLNVAQVKKLIVDGADAKEFSAGRSIRLLNEERSFELARLWTISVTRNEVVGETIRSSTPAAAKERSGWWAG